VDRAYLDAVRHSARSQLVQAGPKGTVAPRRGGNGHAADPAIVNRWPRACLALGLLTAYRHFRQEDDLGAVVAFADAIVDGDGALVPPPGDVGACMTGPALIELFEQAADARYRKAAGAATRFLLDSHVKTPHGTLPYDPRLPSLVLVDTLPMVCPLLARYGVRFEVPEATQLAIAQLREFLADGRSARSGLPFHAFQVDGPAELGMVGWTRGTGWLAMALVDTLAALPNDHEARSELAAATAALAQAVRPFQTENGLWRWAVPAPGGLLDTSGSAMLGYAMAKAVELEVLDGSWWDVAERAAAGVASLTRADGTVDKAQGECIDVGLYPATSGPGPWAQGPAVALAALVLARRRVAPVPVGDGAGAAVIDANLPGGNVLVDRVEGDHVYVRPDPRDSMGKALYWSFRVRRAGGRQLTFHLPGPEVVGPRGPAVSIDGGVTWDWMPAGPDFSYRVPEGIEEVRFWVAMPYQQADLDRLIRRYDGNPHLETGILTTTRKGRFVERLRLGKLDAPPEVRVLLTCRHHARESMASWALEGIVETVLADTQEGAWFREHVELLAVPLMDKDGVEDGDPGKDRKPHDHNRDYLGESIFPEVAALRRFVPEWSEGKLRVALDLHCPELIGGGDRPGSNEQIYFLGNPGQQSVRRLDELSAILEQSQSGPLTFRREHNLPWGQGWNTGEAPRCCSRWAETLPGVVLGTVLEVPFANAGGQTVTIETARALGHDVARALQRFLATLSPCQQPETTDSR